MHIKNHPLGFILLVCLYCSTAFAAWPAEDMPCLEQPEKQASRSNELKELVEADQNECEGFENMSEEAMIKLYENDLIRRKRVGEILGEGCFKTSDDYVAASLIYQHGEVSDHFYQAFVWANRAVQLGDSHQTALVAVTIDRYLVSIGKMQLFGSQAYASDATGWCYCLEPVESSFPDELRKEYAGASLDERYEWLVSVNEGKDCSNATCSMSRLKPSPKGSVPGFW